MPDNEMICGVKVEYLEQVIKLIREKYSIVKKGTKYLETAERKFDLTALSNVRDFLSHIETVFREDILDIERDSSLKQSEEHLRRALVESHQIALELKLEKFLDEYEKYEETMLQNEKKFGLDQITDHKKIRENISKIQTDYNEGRKRKGTNIWNKEWEMGIELFVQGYELANELHGELKKIKEAYYANQYTYRKNRAAIVVAIILFVLSGLVAFCFSPIAEKILEKLLL